MKIRKRLRTVYLISYNVDTEMASQVVVDRDILGWGDLHLSDLRKTYQNVLQVSKHPELPQRNTDKENALYCLEHDCDLITGDVRAHTRFFDAGVKAVRISRLERWKDKDIYLIQIEREI